MTGSILMQDSDYFLDSGQILYLNEYCRYRPGLGIHSSLFWANCLFFGKKWANERFPQTKPALRSFAQFLVSYLSNLLMFVQFWWATWANRSSLLSFSERPEWFAHVAHFWWATWAICSHRSFLVSDLSDLLALLIKKEGMSELLIFKIKNLYKT